MRVIGIDPGSRVCGYGVLEAQNGEVTYLISGCITPNPALPFSQRLKVIYDGLLKVIDQRHSFGLSEFYCALCVFSKEDVLNRHYIRRSCEEKDCGYRSENVVKANY